MSKSNWQTVRDKGLAGSYSCTCLPSALDCLYEGYDFPVWFYKYYTDAFLDQQKNGASRQRTKKVFTKMIHLLTGSTRLEQISFKVARSEEETVSILDSARIGGFKIVVCTQDLHVVGLEPDANGTWKMVGNSVSTSRMLSSREVFHYLYVKKPLRKGKKDPNIYIFPSSK